MIYAGVGSQETPTSHLVEMFNIAYRLASNGFTLRSGGAKGADEAFEKGCDLIKGEKEIFRPSFATQQMIEHASIFHPAWGKLTDYQRRLMGRNSAIILGQDLNDPVDFVVCWTVGGLASGGTGQGLRIAKAYKIPVFNLYDYEAISKLERKTKVNIR